MSGKALESACLAWADSKMTELHLRLGPGEGCRPLEGGCVAMLIDEVNQRLARGCDHGPKGNVHTRAWRDPHSPAQCEDRHQARYRQCRRAGGRR